MPDFQERHQDYVIGPAQDSRLASIAPGQEVTGIEFQFDTDAPFLMRGRAYRVRAAALDSQVQTGLQDVALKYTKGDGDYTSQGYIPQGLVMPYGGQGGAWKAVYPQQFYAAGSVMRLDVLNDGPSTLTDLTLYLRGVKLFPWGQVTSYTYPAKFKILPFVYPAQPINPSLNPYGVFQNLLVTDSRILQQFQVGNDADFVLHYGQAGPSFSPLGVEVAVTLRDESQKAFSNAPVHVSLLFGPSQAVYSAGAGNLSAVGTGNAMPSVFYPEIYLPKNHLLYFDIERNDAGFAGAATIPSYPINLVGAKVYEQ